MLCLKGRCANIIAFKDTVLVASVIESVVNSYAESKLDISW